LPRFAIQIPKLIATVWWSAMPRWLMY